MEKFVPMKKSEFVGAIKKYLMGGFIIRYNSIENEPLEVMTRDGVKFLPTMGNIGNGADKGFLHSNLNCSHKILFDIMDELEKEYSVRNIRCEHSGCCQYATYGVYLD